MSSATNRIRSGPDNLSKVGPRVKGTTWASLIVVDEIIDLSIIPATSNGIGNLNHRVRREGCIEI